MKVAFGRDYNFTVTLSADRDPFFQLDCYTHVYEKDTKQMQNRPRETSEFPIILKIILRDAGFLVI